ncbi:protein MCM10 homolog [Electrophorus electricus]|uniref:protein MCM10 homolog n=1 Tax=Electrophorus electricus TaxID=8005 RepID=UPI0015D09EDE|nr:protein MCM10 homolog [Electrophorus electricus]
MTAEDENLDMLLSLFEENQGQEPETSAAGAGDDEDDLDGLFDDDCDEVYVEPEEEDVSLANLSTERENEHNGSKEHLEAELRSMREKMQKLQQQLLASQTGENTSQARHTEDDPFSRRQPSTKTSPATRCSTKPLTSPQQCSRPALKAHHNSKSSPTLQKVATVSPKAVELTRALHYQDRTAHYDKAASSENHNALGHSVSDRLSQPMRSSSKFNSTVKSPTPSKSAGVSHPIARQNTSLPSVSQDITKEKFSGLRLRRPRLSSVEIEHKMANRRLIRLSHLPERLVRENLEESDWVTFAVVIKKVTTQSKNNGKTFSIWKLNDLHNLEVNVSLFLFGNVHTDLWKTDTGTVIGILNPNPMKNKDGSNELCLTVDHPQKVLMLGEAMDFGTCKGKKKNGDTCTQLVNLNECQYCQYHVKAQYKKMSSKRAELQSSFTGTAPGKRKGQGGLRERLCQSDFHYGGVSSLACAPSVTAPQPKKQPSIQAVLASIPSKKLALVSDEVSGCSDDFRSLMSVPTPGALNIKRHLGQTRANGPCGPPVQSISASDLLKQQKVLHQQRLQARRKRGEEIQKRMLQNTGATVVPARPSINRGALLSPKAASPVPTLGRGFMDGEDIILDMSLLPPPKSPAATKLAAVRKLQAKGVDIVKDDPNAVKRKRPSSSEITTRVERSLSPPAGEKTAVEKEEEMEPAQKRRREQLDYIQSEEFQHILNAKSTNSWIMGEMEEKAMQDYFEPLVQKEKLEEKMKSIREMKCRAVTCRTCKYTHFKPAERCVQEKHDYHWHDAVKRFFRCSCGQRKISLGRFPSTACSNCGLYKWERDSMLKEKNGPKIGAELLLPRGEEQPKFLNSLK